MVSIMIPIVIQVSDGLNTSNSAMVHFFDNLRILICSTSVEKNPRNRMLGWRNSVDGKVSIF